METFYFRAGRSPVNHDASPTSAHNVASGRTKELLERRSGRDNGAANREGARVGFRRTCKGHV